MRLRHSFVLAPVLVGTFSSVPARARDDSPRPGVLRPASPRAPVLAPTLPSAASLPMQVERSGSFVDRIVVGDGSVEAAALHAGRSSGAVSAGAVAVNQVVAADDLDLASYFVRQDVSEPNWDVRLGAWHDTNGDQADFFVFEVGGDDPIQVAALFADGAQGAPVGLGAWQPTGFRATAGLLAGQPVAGIAFRSSDLRLPDGSPLPSSASIAGVRVLGPTVDGAAFLAIDPSPQQQAQMGSEGQIEIRGVRKKWHPVEVWFHGPWSSESANSPNPFLDYRLEVTFVGPAGQAYVIPGFFDGDGIGGGEGDIWKAILAPDQEGSWVAFASFRAGTDVAVELDPRAGQPASFDGASTTFSIEPLDPNAKGFLSQGRLEYVGQHYLKFRDGGWFLKGGTDSPENLLAYAGFDDQTACYCGNLGVIHSYATHVGDWQPGDPNFASNVTGVDGRGIIGALNYLSEQKINSVYFLPMNLGGDGWDTTPFLGMQNNAYDKTHYDISKLRQWRLVFDHAQKKGILLHFVLAETEWQNEQWLDHGSLGRERKLFYRELVARFAHAPALKWNLSEENDYPLWMLRDFADYLGALDVYDHPIAVHNHPNDPSMYQQIAGDPRFRATSVQHSPDQAGAQVEYYRSLSSNAGAKWVVEMDENGPPDLGLADWNAGDLRKRSLYDVYFSGGSLEWYAGAHPLPLGGDQSLENFRTREEMWRYTRFARKILEYVPFWEMQPSDGLLSGESGAYGGGEVFALQGTNYLVYLPSASPSGSLDLGATYGRFRQVWYNPRTGAFEGTPKVVYAGGSLPLGAPPHSSSEDWVVMITRVGAP